jgi:hypothetical protein
MVLAASYPPLQKTQGRGTHNLETGKRNLQRVGHPPNQITAAGMTPYEQLTVNGQVVVTYATFSTPTTTTSGGLFNDVPVGACFASIPPNNYCAPTITQNFEVISNAVTFPITTTATQGECYDTVTVSGTGNPTGKNFSYNLGTP